MRILLDENVRASFVPHLAPHEASHVDTLGLKGLTNRALLDHAHASYGAFSPSIGASCTSIATQAICVSSSSVFRTARIESLLTRLGDILQWLETARVGDRDEI